MKALIPFIIAGASVLMSLLVNLWKREREKIKTDKKVCPKCGNKNVLYRGTPAISGYGKDKKQGLAQHYTFECTKCHTRFEYYGKL